MQFMAVVLLLLGSVSMGCSSVAERTGELRPQALRDLEGYAIASCLVNQAQPYLKDQGDAWASVIVQRTKADVDVLANLAEQVQHESAKSAMAVVRNEANPGQAKALPLLYCNEMIDRPAVRAAIQKAVKSLQ
jgi:hypothetical protein